MSARPSTITKACRAAASDRSALIMGPWLHGNRNTTFAGDVDFGATCDDRRQRHAVLARVPPAVVRPLAEGHREQRRSRSPRVRLFLMGGGTGRKTEAGRLDHGGRWIEAPRWPLPETECRVLLYSRRRAALRDASGGCRCRFPELRLRSVGSGADDRRRADERPAGLRGRRRSTSAKRRSSSAAATRGCRSRRGGMSSRSRRCRLEQDVAVVGPIASSCGSRRMRSTRISPQS